MARSLQYSKDNEIYHDAKCLRCGDKLAREWGDSHSNGYIHLDHPSQIFMHLLNAHPRAWQGVQDEFNRIVSDHPFYKHGHGQVANFEWEAGEMCEDCHAELVGLIGGFFFGSKTPAEDKTISQKVEVNTGTMIGYVA